MTDHPLILPYGNREAAPARGSAPANPAGGGRFDLTLTADLPRRFTMSDTRIGMWSVRHGVRPCQRGRRLPDLRSRDFDRSDLAPPVERQAARAQRRLRVAG